MVPAIATRRAKASLSLCASLAAICLLFLVQSPPKAAASTSPYCGGQQLNWWLACYGASRTLYATSGYGVEHSVCVSANTPSDPYMCSGGPGQSVYNPLGWTANIEPVIRNNGTSWVTVYGTAWQP